ncbi:MAG: hypothetical protein M3Q81_01115 [bacterium]|nr:hypothetical protein [bacterium]
MRLLTTYASLGQVALKYGPEAASHLKECVCALGTGLNKKVLLVPVRNFPGPIYEILSFEVPSEIVAKLDDSDDPCGRLALLAMAKDEVLPDHPFIKRVGELLLESMREEEQEDMLKAALLEETENLKAILERMIEISGRKDLGEIVVEVLDGEYGISLTVSALSWTHLEDQSKVDMAIVELLASFFSGDDAGPAKGYIQ